MLTRAEAAAMAEGSASFAPYGPIGLRLLAPVGDRLLLAAADFPDRHAWLVTGALLGTDLAPLWVEWDDPLLPWHPGSVAFLEGRPEPAGIARPLTSAGQDLGAERLGSGPQGGRSNRFASPRFLGRASGERRWRANRAAGRGGSGA